MLEIKRLMACNSASLNKKETPKNFSYMIQIFFCKTKVELCAYTDRKVFDEGALGYFVGGLKKSGQIDVI